MSFNDIIGQKKAKEIIGGQLTSGRIPHAFLFLGADGVGRRKTALELAKALNCQKNAGTKGPYEPPCDHCVSCRKIDSGLHPDVQTIDFAWQARLENKDVEKQKTIKIDTIRSLQHEINLKPNEGTWKVFIIEPAEKITIEAANCLLKTLEEPPARTVIILLARHRENLPLTIASRTQTIFFSPLPETEIARYLETNASAAKPLAREIARESEGSLSWALSRLGEKSLSVDELWPDIVRKPFTAAELLSASQRYAKNAAEFLTELLARAKTDFRTAPAAFEPALEHIIFSQKLLAQNVNAQMVLDDLLIKLNMVNDQ